MQIYCSWIWLAFGLRVVRVTHDVWVRPLCTKRVLFDHFFAGRRSPRSRIQKGQKSEHSFLRRSEGRATVVGHTFLVTNIRQPLSGHYFWTFEETVKPCRATRLFQILFRWKQLSLYPPISKDVKPLIVALELLKAVS